MIATVRHQPYPPTAAPGRQVSPVAVAAATMSAVPAMAGVASIYHPGPCRLADGYATSLDGVAQGRTGEPRS